MIVENLKNRVINVGVDLIPGVNTLSGIKQETFLKEIETVERYQDLGIIKIRDKDVSKPTENILDLNTNEALSIIKNTFHVEKLEEMIDEEIGGKNRSSIIRAIERQIKTVHSKEKKKESEQKTED